MALALYGATLPAASAGWCARIQVLHQFAGSPDDGAAPSGLTLANGVLYGVTNGGGRNGVGTIFSYDPKTQPAKYSVLYAFSRADTGGAPINPPIVVTFRGRTALYGTTLRGGLYGGGSVYALENGNFTLIHSFRPAPLGQCHDPSGPLTRAGNRLLGTAAGGGVDNHGCVFMVTLPLGNVPPVYRFAGSPDGSRPLTGVTRFNGQFYGATFQGGGVGEGGVVFAMTPGGAESVVHTFNGTDGMQPNGPLLPDAGLLYGVTQSGGGSGSGAQAGEGTVFSLAPDGTFTTLHVFPPPSPYPAINVNFPFGPLAALGGLLYGTASGGGQSDEGVVYSISPSGQLQTVYPFDSGHGGAFPANLVAAQQCLYGTTEFFGDVHRSQGTLFRLTP